MPSHERTRRHVLTSLGATVGLAGCLRGGVGFDAEDGRSTGASPSESTSPQSHGTSTTDRPPCSVEADLPTTEYGPSYPSFPSGDSSALAVDFALDFEAALQRNRAKVLEPEATYDRVESKDATEVRSVESGSLVGVRVEVAYGREVHTSSDPNVESFHRRRSSTAAYFVGDRALRVGTETLTVVDPRDSSDGAVVACEG